MLVTPTQSSSRSPRPRLRAAIIGLGLDGPARPIRIIHGPDCLVVGGSEATRSAMLETMLRLEAELERRGVRLGEVAPDELAEIAQRIDSPELELIAVRLAEGLEDAGRSFHDSTAEELTALAIPTES